MDSLSLSTTYFRQLTHPQIEASCDRTHKH